MNALKIWGRKYLEYKTWRDVLISVNVAGRWRGCLLSNTVYRAEYKSRILQKKKGVSGHSGMYSLTELAQLNDGNVIHIALLFQSMSTEEESST